MICGENMLPVRRCILRSVTEDESLAAGDFSQPQQMSKVSIERNLSQAHHHAQIRQKRNFFIQKCGAVFYFAGQRFVPRWSAANDGRDAESVQTHSILQRMRQGLRREACSMQHRIEKISRSISGEGTTRAIGAVRAWSQAQRQYARVRVAERRNRFSPIGVVGIGSPPDPRDLGAVGPQPRT